MKTGKYILFIVLALLVIGLIIWFLKRREKQKMDRLTDAAYGNQTNFATSTLPGTHPTPVQDNDEFPLTIGSYGQNVSFTQEALNQKTQVPYALLDVDGVFGQLTADTANRVLNDLTGHRKNKVTYSEYNYLVK